MENQTETWNSKFTTFLMFLSGNPTFVLTLEKFDKWRSFAFFQCSDLA